mgnify:CR=1 FL=1
MAKKQFCAVCKSDSPEESMHHCDKCREIVTDYEGTASMKEKLEWYDTWGYTFDNERRSPKKTPKTK